MSYNADFYSSIWPIRKSLLIFWFEYHFVTGALSDYSGLSYSQKICLKTLSGFLKLQIVPNLIHVFSFTYMLMIKFNL